MVLASFGVVGINIRVLNLIKTTSVALGLLKMLEIFPSLLFLPLARASFLEIGIWVRWIILFRKLVWMLIFLTYNYTILAVVIIVKIIVILANRLIQGHLAAALPDLHDNRITGLLLLRLQLDRHVILGSQLGLSMILLVLAFAITLTFVPDDADPSWLRDGEPPAPVVEAALFRRRRRVLHRASINLFRFALPAQQLFSFSVELLLRRLGFGKCFLIHFLFGYFSVFHF